MKTFQFNKLVRDKIPQEIQKDGGKVFSRVLSLNDFLVELVKKVSEESTEINSSLTKPEAVEELADLYEVVSAIQKWFKIQDSQIKTARDCKNLTRGAFRKRIFINRVQVPDDYPWLSHYRKNSDRYQEITHLAPASKKNSGTSKENISLYITLRGRGELWTKTLHKPTRSRKLM